MRIFLCFVLAAIVSLSSAGAPAQASDALDQLFAEYWANEMEEDPFAATFSGVETYDNRVPDVSPDAEARRLEEANSFLVRLRSIDQTGLD